MAGGKTGRDGIHGVTFASLELTEKSEEVSRPAVQIANPIEEEKLKRAIITVRDLELATSITDLGGGGLSSAVGETAKKFNCGVHVELDKVPLKYPNIAPWEIYISESQERMLLTVPEENLSRVLEIFREEDVEAWASLNKLPIVNKKCPYSFGNKQFVNKKVLKDVNEEFRGVDFRNSLVKTFFELRRLIPDDKKKVIALRRCSVCGFATTKSVCRFCRIMGLG